MPIRTYTIEQAARIFAGHYQDHLQVNSPANLIDPRLCNQCMAAWGDLRFALDKPESELPEHSRPVVKVLDGRCNIVELRPRGR